MNKRGFTMIELIIAVEIIFILSIVAIANLQQVYAQARDAQRISDIRQTADAIEAYHADYGYYPDTGGNWRGGFAGCYGGYGYGEDGYIPGLAPWYLPRLLEDPRPTTEYCYVYKSNGVDYMVLAYQTIETFSPGEELHPFTRLSIPTQQSIALYSSGASAW